MSLGALAIVLIHVALYGIHVALYGVAREADEGAAAHLFQLLIVAQVPLIAAFGITRFRRSPGQAVLILLLQTAAMVAALAPVWLLNL